MRVPDAASESPPPGINIDLGAMGAAIGQWFIDHVGDFGNAMWAAFSTWLYVGLHNMFITLFKMTLLTIPHALTDQFGPVVKLMPDPLLIAGAGAPAAMSLLGLKVILQRIPTNTAVVEEVIGRIVLYLAVLGALPWIIARAIDVEQQLAQSIAIDSLESIVSVPAGAMDFTQVIALVIMMWLGVRLWFKLASNVVHVAGAVTWSPIAAICGLFPQSGWVASMWWREFLGRLAGACLATAAVGVGLALALGYPGLLSIAGAGGAFMAAHDLVDWLARTPGQRMGGALGAVADSTRAGFALARGSAAGAAMGAAIPRNEITTRADQFGYD